MKKIQQQKIKIEKNIFSIEMQELKRFEKKLKVSINKTFTKTKKLKSTEKLARKKLDIAKNKAQKFTNAAYKKSAKNAEKIYAVLNKKLKTSVHDLNNLQSKYAHTKIFKTKLNMIAKDVVRLLKNWRTELK